MKDQPAPASPHSVTVFRGTTSTAYMIENGKSFRIPGTNLIVTPEGHDEEETVLVYPDGTFKLIGPCDWHVAITAGA